MDHNKSSKPQVFLLRFSLLHLFSAKVGFNCTINVLTYNVWGISRKFHRKERITALSSKLKKKLLNNAYDIVLLQELWGRDDHEKIYSNLPSGYNMTTFLQLNEGALSFYYTYCGTVWM